MKRSAPDAKTGQAGVSPSVSQEFLGRIPTAAFTVDHTGVITTWSADAVALFGYSPAEVLGRPCESLIPPHAHGEITEARTRILEGKTYCGTLPMRHGNTRLVSVVLNCSLLIDATGKVGMLCQTSHVEQACRAATDRAFVDALLQTSPFGMGMLDHELRYVVVNDALAQMNALPAEEHIGRRLGDVVLRADGGEYEKRFHEVLETGEPVHNMLVGRHVSGSSNRDRAWSVTLFRLAARDGEVLGLGGLVVEQPGGLSRESADGRPGDAEPTRRQPDMGPQPGNSR